MSYMLYEDAPLESLLKREGQLYLNPADHTVWFVLDPTKLPELKERVGKLYVISQYKSGEWIVT